MVYKCDVCGYIYDESTKTKNFEDLPVGWQCPVCGADKESFSLREKGGNKNESNS